MSKETLIKIGSPASSGHKDPVASIKTVAPSSKGI